MRHLSRLCADKCTKYLWMCQRRFFKQVGKCCLISHARSSAKLSSFFVNGVNAIICHAANRNSILNFADSVVTGGVPEAANFCIVKLPVVQAQYSVREKRLSDLRLISSLCDVGEHFEVVNGEQQRAGKTIYPIVFVLLSRLSREDAYVEQVVLQKVLETKCSVQSDSALSSLVIVVLDKMMSSELMRKCFTNVEVTQVRLGVCDEGTHAVESSASDIKSTGIVASCPSSVCSVIKRASVVSSTEPSVNTHPELMTRNTQSAVASIINDVHCRTAAKCITQVLWRSAVDQPLDISVARTLLCNETLFHKCVTAITEEECEVFVLICRLNASNDIFSNWMYCVHSLMSYCEAMQPRTVSSTAPEDCTLFSAREHKNKESWPNSSAVVTSSSVVSVDVKDVQCDGDTTALPLHSCSKSRRIVLITHTGNLSLDDVDILHDNFCARYSSLPLSVRECLLGIAVLCNDHIREERLIYLAQHMGMRNKNDIFAQLFKGCLHSHTHNGATPYATAAMNVCLNNNEGYIPNDSSSVDCGRTSDAIGALDASSNNSSSSSKALVLPSAVNNIPYIGFTRPIGNGCCASRSHSNRHNTISVSADVLVAYAMQAASLLQQRLSAREQAIRTELAAVQEAAAERQKQRGDELLTRAAQKVEFKALMIDAVEEVSMRHEQATAQLVKTLSEMSGAGGGGGGAVPQWSAEKVVSGVSAMMHQELQSVQGEIQKLHSSVAAQQRELHEGCLVQLSDVRDGLLAIQRQLQLTGSSSSSSSSCSLPRSDSDVDESMLQRVVDQAVERMLRRATESGALNIAGEVQVVDDVNDNHVVDESNCVLSATINSRCLGHGSRGAPVQHVIGHDKGNHSRGIDTQAGPYSCRADLQPKQSSMDESVRLHALQTQSAGCGDVARSVNARVAVAAAAAAAAVPVRATRIRRDGRVPIVMQPAWMRRAKQHRTVEKCSVASQNSKKECYFAWYAPVRS